MQSGGGKASPDPWAPRSRVNDPGSWGYRPPQSRTVKTFPSGLLLIAAMNAGPLQAPPAAQKRRRPAIGGPSTKADGVGLDGLDVHCLRSLVAGLGVIGDLRTLSERPVAVADDPGVVDEEVLSAVIRRDEAEALLVAEPLDCAVWHSVIPPRVLCAALRGGSSSNACTALAESIPGPAKRKVAVNRALRESARRP